MRKHTLNAAVSYPVLNGAYSEPPNCLLSQVSGYIEAQFALLCFRLCAIEPNIAVSEAMTNHEID